jgi:hypothetical protein
MQVYSEARPAGGGKVIGITLTDDDMQDVDGWLSLSTGQRFRAMSNRADALIVQYMLRRGDISQEFAAQRLQEIKQGAPS